MNTTADGRGAPHQKRRQLWAPIVAEGRVKCARCKLPILPGQPWDLGHVDGPGPRIGRPYSGPEHRSCNRATSTHRWRLEPPAPEPERDGLPADDKRWGVPWLDSLRDVPSDATWPRLMTVPHPSAVGSLGPEFHAFAEMRSTRPLRWWQKLVSTRLLEVDRDGKLVWETVVLSMARQLGKSWLLRELLLWRIHEGDRFGEPQDVLHTGKNLAVCKEVQRPARAWAKARPRGEYNVREVNGQEEIEHIADGARWMLRAKSAVYGYSVSMAAVDEAWDVGTYPIEEGLTPTMVEREQPQLLLVSTAHRLATSLMLERRKVALANLEVGDGDLLIEWSAPAGAVLDDKAAWRLASPHWSPRRERMISKRLEAARLGLVDPDAEEPDPEQSFRSQWLNQWPLKRAEPEKKDEDLLPPGLWVSLADSDVITSESVFVALEDDFGRGAAVAVVAATDDGRLELDGWLCEDWDSAIEQVQRLALWKEIRELHVGASLIDRVPVDGSLPAPRPSMAAQTRAGLAVFRDLAMGGVLVHDQGQTPDLDRAIAEAQVKEGPAGLQVSRGAKHLVKAAVWAVGAAHRPARIPAIH